MCTVKREELQTDSNYFQLDYFPMNIKKLACSVNNEGSFTSHIIAHNFLKKSYNRNVFHGEHNSKGLIKVRKRSCTRISNSFSFAPYNCKNMTTHMV